MKVQIVTFVGSFLIGGFTSLMMVRAQMKADREYAIQKFSAIADKLEEIKLD